MFKHLACSDIVHGLYPCTEMKVDQFLPIRDTSFIKNLIYISINEIDLSRANTVYHNLLTRENIDGFDT